MKKIILGVILVIALIGGAIGYNIANGINYDGGVNRDQEINLGGGSIRACKFSNALASTSPIQLGLVSSDSHVSSVNLDCEVGSTRIGRLELDAVASSSAVIRWTKSYSNDGIDWYAERTASTTADVTTYGVGANVHSWSPTAGSNQRLSVFLDEDDFASNYLRYTFSVAGASSTLYAVLEKK